MMQLSAKKGEAFVRLIIGGMWHETNTFARDKTRFEDFHVLTGDSIIEKMANTRTEIGGMIQKADEIGIELVPTFHAKCIPSGTVTRDAFEEISLRLLERIDKETHFDGILLRLHGAMVAEDYDDPEGELIRRIRESVGNKPIIATLDLHANISDLMAEEADVLIGYDTYPHNDFFERGFEAAGIMYRILTGEYGPTACLKRLPLMPPAQGLFTSQEPMQSLIRKAHELEKDPEVMTVTVSGGFCYADVPFAGMSILVTTNGNPKLAEEYADELCKLTMSKKEEFVVSQKSVENGIKEADSVEEGPVIIVDAADNIGGGSPGDGTAVLKALKEYNAGPAVVCLADHESVIRAIQAGIGERVRLTVGAKKFISAAAFSSKSLRSNRFLVSFRIFEPRQYF
jgi:microcystin degradation protein MlrC